jgi:hypothetical protein
VRPGDDRNAGNRHHEQHRHQHFVIGQHQRFLPHQPLQPFQRDEVRLRRRDPCRQVVEPGLHIRPWPSDLLRQVLPMRHTTPDHDAVDRGKARRTAEIADQVIQRGRLLVPAGGAGLVSVRTFIQVPGVAGMVNQRRPG